MEKRTSVGTCRQPAASESRGQDHNPERLTPEATHRLRYAAPPFSSSPRQGPTVWGGLGGTGDCGQRARHVADPAGHRCDQSVGQRWPGPRWKEPLPPSQALSGADPSALSSRWCVWPGEWFRGRRNTRSGTTDGPRLAVEPRRGVPTNDGLKAIRIQ